MRRGAEMFGVDSDPEQIARVQALAAECAPSLPPDNFRVCRLSAMPFPDAHFGAVICSAVLHFAEDEADFEGMVREMWRVLEPGGILFARLASTIGIEARVRNLGSRWHRLPDGTDRFLVDEEYLRRVTSELGGELADPIKTTNVQNLRSMTTWVLTKRSSSDGSGSGVFTP
jgi:SAM-dependent methyltransferase